MRYTRERKRNPLLGLWSPAERNRIHKKNFNSCSFQRDSRNPTEAAGGDCPRAGFYSSARWVSIHPYANPRPNTRCCSPCRKHTNGNCNYHANPNNYADPHTHADVDATATARICSQKYGLLFFYCGAVWRLCAKYHQGKQLGCQLYHQRRGCAQNSTAYTHPFTPANIHHSRDR